MLAYIRGAIFKILHVITERLNWHTTNNEDLSVRNQEQKTVRGVKATREAGINAEMNKHAGNVFYHRLLTLFNNDEVFSGYQPGQMVER
jgi:hypothetical protein